MKIIKPVLLGPKLIAVGPLKCFKGGGGGSSGGGGGGGGGGGKGGGGGGGSSSGSKGGTPTESAQARESKELAKQLKKEEEEAEKKRVKSETSMGGQLAGMDFSDIKRDPVTGEQTGEAKQRDDRGFFSKAGDFLTTGETDITKVGEEKERQKDEPIKSGYYRGMTPREVEEYQKDTENMGFFGKPPVSEWKAQKDKATAEGVTDFAFTDQAEVKRLEEEEKAAADLQKARELEAKRVEEEVSPFTKQLAGVDLKKAEFAGKMRQTPLEERQRLAQEEIDKLGFDRIEEAKKKQMQEMSFLDRLTGKEPGFQAARVGPEEIEAIERKYQVDEVEDPGSKALDEFQQSDQFKETLQRERGLLAQNKALEARQAAEERKTLERELAQRRPRPELAPEPEVSPFSKQLSKVDVEKAMEAQDRRAREEQTLARELARRRQGEELSRMAREERESMDAGSQLQADYENRVRKKQAEMDLARGNIQADEYEAVTGEKAPNQLVNQGLRAAKGLVRGMVERGVTPTGVPDVEGAAERAKSYDLADAATDAGLAALGPAGLVAKGLGVDEKVKDFISPVTDPLTRAAKRITDPVVDAVSGVVSPITKPITDKIKAGQQAVMGATDKALGLNQGPVGFTEAAEALAEEADPNRTQQVTTRSGGDRSSGAGILAPAAAIAATALAPKPKPFEVTEVPEVKPGAGVDVQGERGKLVDALKKQASGEESLAEKQIRRTQDRSLAQRLAALKSMRGQDSGSKLRSFSRASDKARREAESQIEIAGMKERRSAQDQLRAQLDTMSREEATERWKKINFDEKQRLLKMSREEAIEKGEYNKWLTVAAMGQKFFKDEIKDAGDWAKTNVLDPVIEGGKKLAKKAGDFVKGALGLDEGGFVSGPGTEMSDSIPARLSDGEFVIKASAVRGIGKSLGAKDKKEERKKGVDFLYKLQDKMDKAEKFAKGGEAYARPKKAFREAIGYKPESRFHDKAEKDAKHGGARRKFRHFQQGGPVSLDVKGMKPQFNIPQSQGFGSVVAAQQDLQRRLEELERQMGR